MKMLLYKIWSKFLEIFGDIKIFNFPMWLVYDNSEFAVNGNKILEISELIEPGDLIFRGYDHYLDSKFIPDTKSYSHGAIYIGNNEIIHAVAKGVSKINIIDFCQCDRIMIMRPRKYKREAIKKAKEFEKNKIPYDYGFNNSIQQLYCFELCGKCYEKLYIPTQIVKKFFGLIRKNDVYLAESFRKSEDFELIFEYNPKFEIDYRK